MYELPTSVSQGGWKALTKHENQNNEETLISTIYLATPLAINNKQEATDESKTFVVLGFITIYAELNGNGNLVPAFSMSTV